MLEKYLRVKEAAELIGVGKSTIWLYAKRGEITSYKLSEKVTVFKQSELLAWVESRLVDVEVA